MNSVFSIANDHKPKAGLTISTSSKIKSSVGITFFSLGSDTDITPETYSQTILYIGNSGKGQFRIGDTQESRIFGDGDLLVINADTLCGTKTRDGLVYTEVIPGKDIIMNEAVKAGEVLKLADLVPYEDGSIVNMDVASNDAMKFVVMAFDDNTALSPHKAPGDALIFALEGEAVIGYEGEEYSIHAGENFRFAKNGLHSVKAAGRFKMGLLITLK